MSPDNPLFHSEELPRFDAVAVDQIVPAVKTLIERQDQARAALETSLKPTWDGLAAPLSALGEPLGYAWNVVHHLLSVRTARPCARPRKPSSRRWSAPR